MTRVPRHRSFARASKVAVPTQTVMWTSCPQACITGTLWPESSRAITLLA